jgi:hypothetical protein
LNVHKPIKMSSVISKQVMKYGFIDEC